MLIICFTKCYSDVLDASECPFADSNDENSNDVEMIDTEMKTKTIDEFQELNQIGFEKLLESMNVSCSSYLLSFKFIFSLL